MHCIIGIGVSFSINNSSMTDLPELSDLIRVDMPSCFFCNGKQILNT